MEAVDSVGRILSFLSCCGDRGRAGFSKKLLARQLIDMIARSSSEKPARPRSPQQDKKDSIRPTESTASIEIVKDKTADHAS